MRFDRSIPVAIKRIGGPVSLVGSENSDATPFRRERAGLQHGVLREVSILRRLHRHENIILFQSLAVGQDGLAGRQGRPIFLVFEECKREMRLEICHGKLEHGIQPSANNREVKNLSWQLLCGTEYLHRCGIMHRDIKPQNLLLDKEGTLKIADFSLSREWRPRQMTTQVSTRYYRAPEILFGATRYTFSIDMWSAGVTIGELLLCKHFLYGKDTIDQLSHITHFIGTPSRRTRDEIRAMDIPKLPEKKAQSNPKPLDRNPLDKRFPRVEFGDTVDFLRGFFMWSPKKRITAAQSLGKEASEYLPAVKKWWEDEPKMSRREAILKDLHGD
ncbi:kinase-like domain-containing protein [Phyllosticta citriasiana]|uniref:Kinase-like domain-containing protein n=1 Tax=Phyllosticta citriasiana TaxID=595635 RepID=A0ABR1KY07_9PEZI